MLRTLGSAGFAVIVLVCSASAQEKPQQPAPATQTQVQPASPTLLQRLTPPAPASNDARPRWRLDEQKSAGDAKLQPNMPAMRGESIALMIAGGALFAAGIITGDGAGAALMLGGALVGAYGLYLHYR